VRRLLAAGLATVAVLTLLADVPTSQAAFSSASSATGSISAAASFAPPSVTTVAVDALPAFVHGTITVRATAVDDVHGVTGLGLQRQEGTSWVDVCTGATSPTTCQLVTTTLANGPLQLRAVATNGAGATTTSTAVATVVDNLAPTVSVQAAASGTHPNATFDLVAAATDAHSGLAQVSIQVRAVGASTWTTLCVGVTSPVSCPLRPTRGDHDIEVRAVAVDHLGNSATSPTEKRASKVPVQHATPNYPS
jgi:hypothetical protein